MDGVLWTVRETKEIPACVMVSAVLDVRLGEVPGALVSKVREACGRTGLRPGRSAVRALFKHVLERPWGAVRAFDCDSRSGWYLRDDLFWCTSRGRRYCLLRVTPVAGAAGRMARPVPDGGVLSLPRRLAAFIVLTHAYLLVPEKRSLLERKLAAMDLRLRKKLADRGLAAPDRSSGCIFDVRIRSDFPAAWAAAAHLDRLTFGREHPSDTCFVFWCTPLGAFPGTAPQDWCGATPRGRLAAEMVSVLQSVIGRIAGSIPRDRRKGLRFLHEPFFLPRRLADVLGNAARLAGSDFLEEGPRL